MKIKSDLTAGRNFQTTYPALILLFLMGLVVGNSGCAGVTSAGSPGNPASPDPPPAITSTTLPAGTLQVAYNAALSATGGTAPYSWRLTSGQLPAGLGLSPSGAVTGMPTQAGTSLFTVKVKDSSSPPQTAAGSLSISVSSGASQVQITTISLASGQVGSAYSVVIAASGGTTPYSWSLTGGTLPTGLGLDTSSGQISGTPTQSGTFPITAQVKDSSSPAQTASQGFSIVVAAAGGTQVSITTSSVPNGQVGAAYSTTLAANGGTAPYTWSISAGTLPAGLSLGAGNGVISGTPTASGSFSFTAKVTDSTSPTKQTATKSFTLTIAPAGSTPVTITTSSVPNGQVGAAYSTTLAANGGTAPYAWSISAGALPAGLSLGAGNGVISGTPTASGSFTFTAKVTDSTSPTKQTATKSFTLTIAPAGSTPVTITTSSVPNGQVGAAYSTTLAANGGTAPYTWSISAGTLPAGLSLGAGNGVISGTPTASGSFSFTAKVTDSTSPTKQTATKSFTLTIAPAGSTPVTITTSSVPNGQVGAAYSTTLAANGGTAPYTWSISAGTLPAGLSLGAGNGVISGTPTASGSFSFTAKVTDSTLPTKGTALKSLSVTIFPAGQPGTSSVWQVVPTAVGWQWTSPTGQIVPKINLISKVDDTDISSATDHCSGGANCETQMETKYGAAGGVWTNWATQMAVRMTSLGFTGAGYYSYRYVEYFPIGGLPYEASQDYGYYAIRDTANGITNTSLNVKDAGWVADKFGMKCAPSFLATTPDPYDPEFAVAFNALYASSVNAPFQMADTIFWQADDGDNVGVMNSCCSSTNAHPDYGYVIAANSPVQSTSSSTAGGTHTFSNKTYFVKLAMRDWLLNEYLCTGAGAPSSFCTGAGTGTGSADPSNNSYVGANNASTALSALNTAWHTSYTTWNTSDLGGLFGISIGTYASWGTGTGFLDENGTHLVSGSVSCGGLTGNGLQQNQAWAAVAQIQTDVDHFMAYGFAVQWATQIYDAYAAACVSKCPPLAIPIYDGPNTPNSSSVYQGIGNALEGKPIPVIFWLAPPFYKNTAGFVAEVQNIINNDNNFPVTVGNYFRANPDSFVGAACDGGASQDCQATQALRGSTWVDAEQGVLRLQNPAGKYAIVGYEHWSMWDSKSQTGDFGLFTDNDNAYDGSAASTATSSGPCLTSSTYTQPAICQDPNGNYQSLATASCTSGASAPTWNTNYNGLTPNDGNCNWFNNGAYARNAEASDWGDALLPIVNFQTSSLVDP